MTETKEYVAYAILGMAFVFGVLPIIGDTMLGGVNGYRESLACGATVVGSAIALISAAGAVMWALVTVGWM